MRSVFSTKYQIIKIINYYCVTVETIGICGNNWTGLHPSVDYVRLMMTMKQFFFKYSITVIAVSSINRLQTKDFCSNEKITLYK